MEINFLTMAEVLSLHQDQIRCFGGTNGIRDINLLVSAIGCPAATYDGQFLHTNIYEMASAYLFHIVKNHPFVDGNKRTGVMVTLTFLKINGCSFNAPNDDFLELVLDIARGKRSKAEITVFIQQWTKMLNAN